MKKLLITLLLIMLFAPISTLIKAESFFDKAKKLAGEEANKFLGGKTESNTTRSLSNGGTDGDIITRDTSSDDNETTDNDNDSSSSVDSSATDTNDSSNDDDTNVDTDDGDSSATETDNNTDTDSDTDSDTDDNDDSSNDDTEV